MVAVPSPNSGVDPSLVELLQNFAIRRARRGKGRAAAGLDASCPALAAGLPVSLTGDLDRGGVGSGFLGGGGGRVGLGDVLGLGARSGRACSGAWRAVEDIGSGVHDLDSRRGLRAGERRILGRLGQGQPRGPRPAPAAVFSAVTSRRRTSIRSGPRTGMGTSRSTSLAIPGGLGEPSRRRSSSGA